MKKYTVLLLAFVNSIILCSGKNEKEHSLTPFPNPTKAEYGSMVVEISASQPSHSNSDIDFMQFAGIDRSSNASLVYMQPGEENKEGATRPAGLSIEIEGAPNELSKTSSGESHHDGPASPPSPMNPRTPSSKDYQQRQSAMFNVDQPNPGLTASLSAGAIASALRGTGGITSPKVLPSHQRSPTTSLQNDSQSNCHNLATDEGIRPSDMYPRASITHSTSASAPSTLSYPQINDPSTATTPNHRKRFPATETVTSTTVRADLAIKSMSTESPSNTMKQHAQKQKKGCCTVFCSYILSLFSAQQQK